MHSTTPDSRVHPITDRPINARGEFVVYWMIASRRTRFNFALERAAEWARHLGRPLLVLEPLRSDYQWASARLHRFVIDGMAANLAAVEGRPVAYYPFVEKQRGAGRGLLGAIAARAAVVVTDLFPTFFLPRMVAAAGSGLPVRLEAVDGNGLIPLTATQRDFSTAYAFRRFVQNHLLEHLGPMPLEDPLHDLAPPVPVPAEITDRWPVASEELLSGDPAALSKLPIDHSPPAAPIRGGAAAGERTLREFLDRSLEDYVDLRNRPDDDVGSGLSPYLHFGHVSAHQVFLELVVRQRWSPEDVRPPHNGRREGWWGMSPSAEAFLDQVVTWRELGFHFCHHRPDHARYESLPDWAKRTLAEHASDPREHLYSLEQLDEAATHDPLWNAAQNQLRREGRIHNYLRMLWGKKILEWTAHPRDALDVMIELNNRYALDGRDPNSYTGIFWVLGRHDRPWGPERPVFGKIRYMSSENTARKVPVKLYRERYS